MACSQNDNLATTNASSWQQHNHSSYITNTTHCRARVQVLLNQLYSPNWSYTIGHTEHRCRPFKFRQLLYLLPQLNITSLSRPRITIHYLSSLSDMAATMSTPAFHRFAELPTELQIEIWKIAFDAEDLNDKPNDINQYYGLVHSPKLSFLSPYSSKKVSFDLRYTEDAASVRRVCRTTSRFAALVQGRRGRDGFLGLHIYRRGGN